MPDSLLPVLSAIDFTKFVGSVKDILLSVGACVAMHVGLKGLSTWRRQLLGSAEHDVARRILRASLKMREAIRGVRSPAMWGDEMERGVKKYGPTDRPATQLESTRAAYALRFEKVDEARLDLDLETIEGEILWGEGIRTLTDKLHLAAGELGIALMQYLAERKTPESPINDRTVLERQVEEEMRIRHIVFFGGGPDDDTLTAKITDTLKEIDTFCRPKLRYEEGKKVGPI